MTNFHRPKLKIFTPFDVGISCYDTMDDMFGKWKTALSLDVSVQTTSGLILCRYTNSTEINLWQDLCYVVDLARESRQMTSTVPGVPTVPDDN